MTQIGKEKTAAKSTGLTIREWAELDYAAEMHGRTRNAEVRWHLQPLLPEAIVDAHLPIAHVARDLHRVLREVPADLGVLG